VRSRQYYATSLLGRSRPSSSLDFAGFHLVDVAPNPGFPRFNGAHERVMNFVEMLGGVFILGRVATTDLSAGQAHPQMDPGVAYLHAFFADMLARFLDFDLVEVRTFIWHRALQNFASSGSSDHGHVTKGHNHINPRPPSLTMIPEVFQSCFVLIISRVC
jgi:hypothetical protein